MHGIQSFCDLPFTRCIVDAIGDVSMCCHQYQKLGNIFVDDLLNIWNSPVAKAIRATTLDGELHPVCKSWNTCPFFTADRSVMKSFKVHDGYVYPTHLKICLPNTHCNIGGETPSDDNPACIMCGRNWNVERQPDRTDELCDRSRSVMPHLLGFSVLGLAEPFWKDALFRIFENLNFEEHKERIKFTTSTNAICLTERAIQKLFSSTTRSEISFSIDASSRSTYEKIRRVDAYDLVLDHIRIYQRLRTSNHRTVIFNNINLLNVDEMPGMVRTAAELGVDKLVMVPTTDMRGKVDQGFLEICLNQENVAIFATFAEKAKELAAELGVRLQYNQPFDVVPPSLDELGVEPPAPKDLVQISLS